MIRYHYTVAYWPGLITGLAQHMTATSVMLLLVYVWLGEFPVRLVESGG